MFIGLSFAGGLYINEDNNGSASVLAEDTKHEDPWRRECKFPSRNSFLKKESVELDPPLRKRLLRCTLISVKEKLNL